MEVRPKAAQAERIRLRRAAAAGKEAQGVERRVRPGHPVPAAAGK